MKINHHINAATKMRLLMTLLLTSTIMGAGNQGGGGCGSSSGNSNNSPSNTGQAPSGGSVDLSINITPKDPAADYGKCMTNTSAPTQICSQPSPSPSPALINYVQGWRCGGFSAAMCSSISADRAAEEEARCMDYHNGYVSADPMVRQEAKNMCTLYPVTWGDSTFYCRCPEWIIKDAAIQSSVYNPPLAGFSTPVGQVSCMTGGDQMFCQVIGPSIAPTPSPSTTPHCYNTEDMDRLISKFRAATNCSGTTEADQTARTDLYTEMQTLKTKCKDDGDQNGLKFLGKLSSMLSDTYNLKYDAHSDQIISNTYDKAGKATAAFLFLTAVFAAIDKEMAGNFIVNEFFQATDLAIKQFESGFGSQCKSMDAQDILIDGFFVAFGKLAGVGITADPKLQRIFRPIFMVMAAALVGGDLTSAAKEISDAFATIRSDDTSTRQKIISGLKSTLKILKAIVNVWQFRKDIKELKDCESKANEENTKDVFEKINKKLDDLTSRLSGGGTIKDDPFIIVGEFTKKLMELIGRGKIDDLECLTNAFASK